MSDISILPDKYNLTVGTSSDFIISSDWANNTTTEYVNPKKFYFDLEGEEYFEIEITNLKTIQFLKKFFLTEERTYLKILDKSFIYKEIEHVQDLSGNSRNLNSFKYLISKPDFEKINLESLEKIQFLKTEINKNLIDEF